MDPQLRPRRATIVPLPEQAWEVAWALPPTDAAGAWWVVVDLWSQEEGRTDLSLEAEVTETADGVRVVIEDIHVL